MRIVIDEDMPRSLGPCLDAAGHQVFDVRDHDLRGQSDQEVFRFAQQQEAVLITEDLGFGNLLRFPIGRHHGIVVGRFPSTIPCKTIVSEVVELFNKVTPADVAGALIIVSPGQIRVRRPD
ncbi:MAG: DUF5615 family PIN-like protein [Phycisphaerae bacterium]